MSTDTAQALIGANDRTDEQTAFIEAANAEAAAEAGTAADDSEIAQTPPVKPIPAGMSAAEVNALLDKRMAGFQQLLAQRDEETERLRKQLREYEIAGMSEDERAQVAQQERDEEVERLRLENELYRLGESHPKGATLYRRLLQPGLTAEQQVALLDELLNPTATSEGQAQPATRDTVPVDHNNPAHTIGSDVEVLPNGEIMTDEVADRILATERWRPA